MAINNDCDYNISLNDTNFLNNEYSDEDLSETQNACKKQSKKKKFKIDPISTTKYDINEIVNLDRKLSAWGLPESVLIKYKEKGIIEMFEWQVECLGNKKVLEDNCNLIYSAPTSAGKTLVAEILALKTLLEKRKKVIVILPFVSVVREKMYYFQDILSITGIRVEGFMGSYNPPGGFKAVQCAICTIEKANSIINKLLEEGSLHEIGAVIVDEMHLVGDPSRGYLLELLLTKLLYMAARDDQINIQLIGMSATLSNLNVLSKWLNAELYTTNFRPIPLDEFCLIAGEIFDKSFKVCRRLQQSPELTEDSDNVLQLCLETISNSCSVLIFCPTKNWCENLAQQISLAFWKLGRSESNFGVCLRRELNGNLITEILEQLKRCPVGLDSILKKTISFGVAFHHAGLTMDERDIIEGAFRNGALRVLVATSTLSSGVNLPAQRVIIRTPMFHGKPLDCLVYRQMIGRAGRMGRDVLGESILICQKNDKIVAEQLLGASLYPIESCLEGSGRLKRAILEIIASGIAVTPEDVTLFTNSTLLAASEDESLITNNPIEKSVEFLVNNEFIRLQKSENGELRYVATSLAKACLLSSLPPEDGLALFEEIEKARQCFVLDTDLHILYLVTPYSVCNQWTNLNWMQYLDFYEKLTPNMKRVASLVGVEEAYIINATRGKINTNSSKQYHKLQIHRRFYTALALQDLVNEISLNSVAAKFQCNRGMLQSLQQSASMFAGMVSSFCHQLGWKCVELLVSQFQDRLQFGIQHDLLDLMKLPNLNGPRARALYNAGIETLSELASIDICKLENVLFSSVPFESEKERDGETAYDVEQKKKIRGIFITGKQGLTPREAAYMLIQDARKYLQMEIGAAVLQWSITDSTNTKTQFDSTDNGNINEEVNQLTQNNTLEKNINITSNPNNISIKETINIIIPLKSNHTDKKTDNIEFNIIENVNKTIANRNNEIKNDLNNSEGMFEDENVDTFASNCQLKNSDVKKCTNELPTFVQTNGQSICDVFDSNWTAINNVLVSSNISNNEFEINMKNISLNLSKEDNDIFDSPQNLKNDGKQSIYDNDEFKINSIENKSLKLNNKEDDLVLDSCRNNSENGISESIYNDVFESNWTVLNHNSIKSFTNSINESLSKCNISVGNKSGSLFEESLNMDTKLCEALDEQMEITEKLENKRAFEMEDSSFFNNIPNTFQIEKLQIELDLFDKESDLEENQDIVDTSQSEITDCGVSSIYNSIKKSKKEIETPKKRNRNSETDFCKELQTTPKKKLKMESEDELLNDYTKINIIDVCKDKNLFNIFCKELITQKIFSLAVASEYNKQEKVLIGQNVINSPKVGVKVKKTSNLIGNDNSVITGLAISCGNNLIYFISFLNEDEVKNDCKIKFLKTLFDNSNLNIRIFDYKEHFKILYKSCKIIINSYVEDPLVLDWLHNPEEKENNLCALILKYTPEIAKISHLAGKITAGRSIALDYTSSIKSYIRASVEALASWFLVDSQKKSIANQNAKVLNVIETEMKCISCLARMELIGFLVDKSKINSLISEIQTHLNDLQQQAFTLAGRQFSFTSSKDVAKVLGIYKGKRINTNKQKLLESNNPLSNLIMQWRKLNCTLTKMILPLLRSLKDDGRIHGFSVTHTATGRITMHEPNLQNVPRNYDIEKLDKRIISLSVRSSFVSGEGMVFISADYCQLELRILAEMSQDSTLCNIMKSKEDIFNSVAANLNKIPKNEVTDTLRQQAKHLCYGIIYGMGSKVLSKQLHSTEEEAIEFSLNFKNTYPKIQQFIETIITVCRSTGYVETIFGRRRYLPNINCDNTTQKNQAERQAVNTIIQGSAADIVKKAMVSIDSELYNRFGSNHKVFLVLQLHDELLYEVPINDLKNVATIMKNCMEGSVSLSVPFPVKLKSGYSWGELKEFLL